jgi:NTP pyrophosphatase (non-canonical NTP hydrolase)
MEIDIMLKRARRNHIRRGYTNDLPTLGLGLCEEAGEVAKAINLLNPLYVPSPHAKSDSLEHELCDVLVYVCSIANAANIDLDKAMEEKLIYRPLAMEEK